MNAKLNRLGQLVLASVVTATAAMSQGSVEADTDNAEDQSDAAIITRGQIEADWLLQDVVRSLPAIPEERRRVAAKDVTTQRDAAGGCDGNKDGTFGFHTSGDPSPWWQVDLGETMAVDRIVIYNRCDGNVEDRAGRLKVLLSDDGETWSQLYQHDGSKFFGYTDNKPLSVAADTNSARFVRIQLPDQQYFHLDEVEVYGKEGNQNIALRRPADQSSTSKWSTVHFIENVERQDAAADDEPAYPTDEVVERGRKLAESLRRLGVDVTPWIQELDAARATGSQADASADERRASYLKARWAVREMTLANPRLDFDDILFVKRVPGTFTHMSDQYYGWFSRPGGGLYVLEDFKSEQPTLRCLTADFEPGSFLRPDISYDGRRVLFAYCRHHRNLRFEQNKLDKSNVPEDAFYHLFEMNMDGTGLRQLTHGKYDDFDGRYLASGDIVFLSTRRGQYVQCGKATAAASSDGDCPDCYVRCGGGPSRPVAVYTLHVMDASGGNLCQISPFEMFEWTPSVDHEGRILYARWDYVDRHNMPYMSLWSTLPDGTNPQAVYGNMTRNPHCVFEARGIPDSRQIIFTASGHHANTGGSLVLLDPRKGNDGEGPITRLTPEVAFPESEGWPQTYFANPYPLSEEHYLVAWSAAPLPPGTPPPEWGSPALPNNLGLYLFDAFGNLNLIYRDATISSATPIPIRPRRRPPEISSYVNWDGHQEGRMVVQDVYRGLEMIPRGTIRQLRLVGVPVKTHPTINFPSIGLTRDDPGKFVMGTVPVEADGSAHFRVPAGVPFFVQALDEEGIAVQTMRSATSVQPGQTFTCIGCHEPRNMSPASTSPLALAREPSRITPGPDGSWPLGFQTLVGPVLEKHCVRCHKPEAEGEKFDLTPEKSYDCLVGYGKPSLRDHVLARYSEGRSEAGAGAAQTSVLLGLLRDGHYEVQLDDDDLSRLVTWMDTYAQRQGSFSEEQEERLLKLKQKMADMLALP